MANLPFTGQEYHNLTSGGQEIRCEPRHLQAYYESPNYYAVIHGVQLAIAAGDFTQLKTSYSSGVQRYSDNSLHAHIVFSTGDELLFIPEHVALWNNGVNYAIIIEGYAWTVVAAAHNELATYLDTHKDRFTSP